MNIEKRSTKPTVVGSSPPGRANGSNGWRVKPPPSVSLLSPGRDGARAAGDDGLRLRPAHARRRPVDLLPLPPAGWLAVQGWPGRGGAGTFVDAVDAFGTSPPARGRGAGEGAGDRQQEAGCKGQRAGGEKARFYRRTGWIGSCAVCAGDRL